MEEEIAQKLKKIDNDFFINWYSNKGRYFPWRDKNVSPFHILLTEILLKQTKAEDVALTWNKITDKYSNPHDILKTNIQKIKKDIEGLGLVNTRSEAFKKISNELVEKFSSNVPANYETLINLPYIGKYTANAILCFGFKSRRAIVDNNILRLFSRILGIKITQKDIRRNPWAWEAANKILPPANYVKHNYGLLDFTADTCTFYKPKCKACPLNKFCVYGNAVLESSN